MKFNIPEKISNEFVDEIRVGNVYKCKGGNKTRFWVCMGFDEQSVSLLGLGANGEVTSAVSYGRHVFSPISTTFKPREVVGFCESLEQLEFDITWRE